MPGTAKACGSDVSTPLSSVDREVGEEMGEEPG
jgi:hypothetical protein